MAPRALLIGCSLLASALGVSAAAAAAAKAASSEAEGAAQLEASSQNKSRREATGFVVPLHVRRGASCSAESKVAEVAMYIRMRTEAVRPSQYRLMRLDCGSATLGFCPNVGPAEIFKQNGDFTFCDQYSPGTAWFGFQYSQPLIVDQGGGNEFQVQGGPLYSVMTQNQKMGCGAGAFDVGGIFGIGFKPTGSNYVTPNIDCFPTANTPASEYCKADCFQPAPPTTPVINNFFNRLGVQQSLGIYWTGELGDEQGTMYVDEQAFENPHYNAGNEAKAMYAFLGDEGYYSFRAVSVEFVEENIDGSRGPSYSSSMEGECEKVSGACVMDTGTPGINLPAEIYSLYNTMSMHSYMLITLQGLPGSPNPVLKFFKSELEALKMYGPTSTFGAVLPGPAKGQFGSFVLGLATWASYYTIFDIRPHLSLIIVPHTFCYATEPVTCPGHPESPVGCGGRGGFQCCPPASESFQQSFPCPSTPAGHICGPADPSGTFAGKVSNCLAPALPCDVGQPR